MMQRPSAGGPADGPRHAELPRAVVDTRMPPAPAPGGRIIKVDAPKVRVKKGGLDAGFLLGALAIALIITTLWRGVRRARVPQSLL